MITRRRALGALAAVGSLFLGVRKSEASRSTREDEYFEKAVSNMVSQVNACPPRLPPELQRFVVAVYPDEFKAESGRTVDQYVQAIMDRTKHFGPRVVEQRCECEGGKLVDLWSLRFARDLRVRPVARL